MRRWGTAAALTGGLIAGTLLPAVPAAAVHGAVPGDFNGDGYRDAVLPAPGANVSGKEAAGAVVVLYGSSSGLSASRRKTITQNTAGVPGTAEAYDRFGAATATADLNRDGYADLLVSSPYEDTTKGVDAGTVTILWGGANGLSTATNLPTPSAEPRHYGLDLAVLSTGSGSRTQVLAAGWDAVVHVKGPFSKSGSVGSAELNQNTASVGSVALGDFDDDNVPDPAVATVRLHDISGGEIYTNLAYGHQLRGNGLTVASGDINGDGHDDLVAGDPDEPLTPGVDGATGGRVLVWYGTAEGVASAAQPVEITQDTEGVPGGSEKGDAFGAALAVADVNRDGLADILVGAPHEALGSTKRAGMVTVIPGRASGALGTGSYSFTQSTSGVPGGAEADDFFGTTVAAGDVNKDGRPELFISAAGENNHTGGVWVLPGGTSRPTASGSKVYTARSIGLTQDADTLVGGNGLLWDI
ncbi:VCBS repeat-containing protein [Streptomyces sp. NPDC058867]|uniref:VCBS repeat-containing protein n=1 Tax=unclassified Streptomyces TaxID=2593676 RepID=UPI0036C9E783